MSTLNARKCEEDMHAHHPLDIHHCINIIKPQMSNIPFGDTQ
jgi:hypothetical protein